MKLIKYLFLSLAFLINAPAQADAVSDLNGLLNQVQSMRADFTQTVYDNKHQAVQISYGRLDMQRPGKFRWDVTKPIPQLIIANQSRLWIYDKDLEQVTIRNLTQGAGEAPALLLTHTNTDLAKNFTVTPSKKQQAGWSWFKLTPKKQDSMFASLEMGFKGNQIQEMYLQDHLGHVTGIVFNNIKTNPSLSESLFTFKAPRNVDVIDETRKR